MSAVTRWAASDLAIGAAVNTQDAIRTCVGCRQRATATELLRVVVAPEATGDAVIAGDTAVVVPDPRRRMPGRGAWVHPDPACVALAQRRRAFGRALRVPGPADPAPVVEYVAAHYGVQEQDRPITSGNPQETKS